MLKKTITYNDFDGNPVTEDVYFNLTKAELAEMQLESEGGLQERLQKVVQSGDGAAIIREFKAILERAYGERSPDGKRFIKNKSAWENFTQTEGYSELFMDLVTNAESAAEFIKAIVPSALADKLPKNPPRPDTTLPETPAPSNLPQKPDVPSPSLGSSAAQDDRPAWLREGRQPTQAELRNMSKDELVLAMQQTLNKPK